MASRLYLPGKGWLTHIDARHQPHWSRDVGRAAPLTRAQADKLAPQFNAGPYHEPINAASDIEPPTERNPAPFDADPPTQRRPRRHAEAGFARLEPLYLVAGATAGFVAAPRLNAKITVRPLGRHVPPSAVATVAVLLGAGLARRYGQRKTAVAAFGLGLGLGLGTLASARDDGGLLGKGA